MGVRKKLSAEKIAEAALDMLDTNGLSGFTMRKLAVRLSVDPMAIYHHHKSKDALIHAVLNEMMSRCPIPAHQGVWQQDLRDLCQGLRDLAQVHPGAFRIYETYERWLPSEHLLHEALYKALDRAGFEPQTIMRAAHLLMTYTEAFAVDEISGWHELGNEPAYHASLANGNYPTLSRLKGQTWPVDSDADFAFGLDVLIRGLECELEKKSVITNIPVEQQPLS